MSAVNVQQMAARVAELFEARLNVGGRTLAEKLRRGGRRLPRKVRREAAYLRRPLATGDFAAPPEEGLRAEIG